MKYTIDDKNVWNDGRCLRCNSIVYEMPCEHDPYNKESYGCDYMNLCSNEKCENHKFHYVGDQEFADYYVHINFFTCNECGDKETCQYAFDLYNTDGDCLMEK